VELSAGAQWGQAQSAWPVHATTAGAAGAAQWAQAQSAWPVQAMAGAAVASPLAGQVAQPAPPQAPLGLALTSPLTGQAALTGQLLCPATKGQEVGAEVGPVVGPEVAAASAPQEPQWAHVPGTMAATARAIVAMTKSLNIKSTPFESHSYEGGKTGPQGDNHPFNTRSW
jgi:hypothetical protein